MSLSELQWHLMTAANDATAGNEGALVIDWGAIPLVERVAVWWGLKGLEARGMLQRVWCVRRCRHILSPFRGWKLPDGPAEIIKRRTYL